MCPAYQCQNFSLDCKDENPKQCEMGAQSGACTKEGQQGKMMRQRCCLTCKKKSGGT